MKKKKVTYGITGLMECQVVIKLGKNSSMKVHFSDGSMTAMGVNPATFTTSDFMVQHAIERSSDYKRGRIHKVRSIELDEEVKIERNRTSGVTGNNTDNGENIPKPSKTVKRPAKEEKAPAKEKETSDTEVADKTEADETTEADEVTDTEQSDNKPALKQVKVSDLAAAKDYLADKFGISRTALRSQKAILEHAAANGIEFEGLE